MSIYNRAIMSGFVSSCSIRPGILSVGLVPGVVFEVVTGKTPYSVFIVNAKMALEMYAWKISMTALKMKRMHVVSKADLYASGSRTVLILKEIEYHTSNPELRVAVERLASDMLSGRSEHEWPKQTIRLPLKVVRHLGLLG